MIRIAFNAALLTTALLVVSVRANQTNPGRLSPETLSSTEPQLAAQSTRAASRNTEALAFSDVAEAPTDRDLLSDTAKESWYFVPSWSDTRSAVGPQPTSSHNRAGRYRQRSPFILFDKKSRSWRTVAISHHAYEIFPVRQDSEDPSLIWFGCNDSRNGIIDWVGVRTSGAVDDPLVFGANPGGLGLIDTARRTVTYFGPYRDLVGGGVYELLFEKEAVWVWGRSAGARELNGLSRFDRRTRTFEPLPIASHGVDDAWIVRKLTSSDAAVSLSVLEGGGEWFNRYEFDKARRQWRQLRYGWVSSVEVPIFEQPDETSKRVDVLEPGIHFGKHGHDHYGHPVVILEEQSGWQRVITCRDIVGWTRSGALVDTLEFFRLTLNSPAAGQDRGNDGPRIFLWRAHSYMSHDEIQKEIEILRNNPEVAAVFKGLFDREELGITLGRELSDRFITRRSSLR